MSAPVARAAAPGLGWPSDDPGGSAAPGLGWPPPTPDTPENAVPNAEELA